MRTVKPENQIDNKCFPRPSVWQTQSSGAPKEGSAFEAHVIFAILVALVRGAFFAGLRLHWP